MQIETLPREEKRALWARLKKEAPEIAAFVQQGKEVFGDVSVVRLTLGGEEFGEPVGELFPFTVDYDHKRAMDEWEASIGDPQFQKARATKKATKIGRRGRK